MKKRELELKEKQADAQLATAEATSKYIDATKDNVKEMAEAARSFVESDTPGHVGLVGIDADIQDVSAEKVNVLATKEGSGTVGVKNAHIGRISIGANVLGFQKRNKDEYSSDKVDPSLTLAANKSQTRELPEIDDSGVDEAYENTMSSPF